MPNQLLDAFTCGFVVGGLCGVALMFGVGTVIAAGAKQHEAPPLPKDDDVEEIPTFDEDVWLTDPDFWKR